MALRSGFGSRHLQFRGRQSTLVFTGYGNTDESRTFRRSEWRRAVPVCVFGRLRSAAIAHLAVGQKLVQNTIHNLDTKWFENETGEFPAILMGLNILEPEDAEAFLDGVVEKWKCQRMCSAPITANMTITLVGDMTAARFRDLWLVLSRRPDSEAFYVADGSRRCAAHSRSGATR